MIMGDPRVTVDRIVDWENGELDEPETVDFFQGLIDTGMAWTLQGCYGRAATALIREGLCTQKGK